jgi:hypothetical protein
MTSGLKVFWAEITEIDVAYRRKILYTGISDWISYNIAAKTG